VEELQPLKQVAEGGGSVIVSDQGAVITEL